MFNLAGLERSRWRVVLLLTRMLNWRQSDGMLWFHFVDVSDEYDAFKLMTERELIVYTGMKDDLPRHQFPRSAYRLTDAGNWVLTHTHEWVYYGLTSDEELNIWLRNVSIPTAVPSIKVT